MKIDWIKTLIAVLINALMVYGMYVTCSSDTLRDILIGVSAVVLTITGVFTLGVSVEGERSAIMVKIVSGIFYAVLLVVNWIFTVVEFTIPLFIIINGILLLLYALVIVSMARTKQ